MRRAARAPLADRALKEGRAVSFNEVPESRSAADLTRDILDMAENLLEQAAHQDVAQQEPSAIARAEEPALSLGEMAVAEAAGSAVAGGRRARRPAPSDDGSDVSVHTWATTSCTDSTAMDRQTRIELPLQSLQSEVGITLPLPRSRKSSAKPSFSRKGTGESALSLQYAEQESRNPRLAAVFSRLSRDGDMPCERLEWALMFAGHIQPDCTKITEALEGCFGSSGPRHLSMEQFLDFGEAYDQRFQADMMSLFREADALRTGSISSGVCSALLRHVGLTPFNWVVDQHLAEVCSRRGDGCNADDFAQLLQNVRSSAGFPAREAEDIRDAYWHYERSGADRNEPGCLDAAGTRAALRRLGSTAVLEGLPEIFHPSIAGAILAACADEEDENEGTLTSLSEHEFLVVMRFHREQDFRRIYAACSDEDTDLSGTVRVQHLPRIFRSLGYVAWSSAFIEEVAKGCSFQEDSKLLFEDVCKVYEKCQQSLGICTAEMQHITSAFERYNFEQTESVDHAVVLGALRWLGYSVTPQSVLDIQLDVFGDADFRMDFRDFTLFLARVRELDMQQLQAYFAKHGVDGEVEVSKAKGILQAVGCCPPDGFKDLVVPLEDKERLWLGVWEAVEYIAEQRSRIRDNVHELEGLTESQVNKLRARFQHLDLTGNTGDRTLQVSEFNHELCHRFSKLIPWARKIFTTGAKGFQDFLRVVRFVTDRVEGDLLRRERVVVAEIGLTDIEVQDFRQLFRAGGGEKSGTVSYSAFGRLLSGVVPSSIADTATGELHARLRKSDSGGCGYLNFPDFIHAIWSMQRDDWHGINGVAKAIVERDGKNGRRREAATMRH